MNALEIQKIGMYGFKHHEDLIEYALGKYTRILGANRQGKTTIGEVITWVFLGADLTGNERATTRLTNRKSKDVYGELEFVFKGEQHTLIRRKKGNTTSIFLNDKTVKQTDLVSFYNSKELFLSIFNPTYFPALAPKDAKAVLDSVLEEVKKEEVYEKLSKGIVDTLKKTGFGNPNLYLENQRARLKEIDDDLQYWKGFKEGKQEDIEIPEILSFDEKPLLKLNKELEEINKIEVSQLHNITDLLAKRDGLRTEIGEIGTQISTIVSSKPNLKDISELSIEVNTLRNNYRNKQEFIAGLNSIVTCPECETVIDLDEDAKNKALKELEELKVKGTNVANQLKKIELENIDIKTEHEKQTKEKLKDLKESLTKLESEMEALNIRNLQQENLENANKQEGVIADKRNKITSEIKSLEHAKQQMLFSNSQREDMLKRKESIEAKIKGATKSIKELQDEESQVKVQIDYAKQFASKRLDIQSEQIKKHLNKVTIQLEKVIESTGVIKPDFKILYDGKEFAILSNSERIEAGLEVANLLMNVSGLYVPIFVDNAESITDIPKLDTQMIEARVKEDTVLEVEVA